MTRAGLVGRLGRPATLVPLLLALGLALLPQFVRLTSYELHLLTSVFMYAALASSVNIIAGYVGYADFGNVVYFGVGAFTTGILLTRGWPVFLGMIAGSAVAGLYAAILGWPILRLRGHYFAIATIGVLGLTSEIALNLSSLTRGGQGMSLPLFPGTPAQFAVYNYYVMGAILALFIVVSHLVRGSRFGFALRALHADEDAAAVVGIYTTRAKILAWVLSASMTALVGGAYAYWSTFIIPSSVFDIVVSTKYFIMMLLGGAGTVWGPVVGAVVLEAITDVTWQQSASFSLGFLGIAIVLVVVFLPRGVWDWARDGFRLRVLVENVRRNRV